MKTLLALLVLVSLAIAAPSSSLLGVTLGIGSDLLVETSYQDYNKNHGFGASSSPITVKGGSLSLNGDSWALTYVYAQSSWLELPGMLGTAQDAARGDISSLSSLYFEYGRAFTARATIRNYQGGQWLTEGKMTPFVAHDERVEIFAPFNTLHISDSKAFGVRADYHSFRIPRKMKASPLHGSPDVDISNVPAFMGDSKLVMAGLGTNMVRNAEGPDMAMDLAVLLGGGHMQMPQEVKGMADAGVFGKNAQMSGVGYEAALELRIGLEIGYSHTSGNWNYGASVSGMVAGTGVCTLAKVKNESGAEYGLETEGSGTRRWETAFRAHISY